MLSEKLRNIGFALKSTPLTEGVSLFFQLADIADCKEDNAELLYSVSKHCDLYAARVARLGDRHQLVRILLDVRHLTDYRTCTV